MTFNIFYLQFRVQKCEVMSISKKKGGGNEDDVPLPLVKCFKNVSISISDNDVKESGFDGIIQVRQPCFVS